uniref:Uncharacterized protein n=1 Tax=Oryza rufipogon TaxID=4529 RepID=A0A0E0R5X2_ORYRU
MDELFLAGSGREGGEREAAGGGPVEGETECSGGEDEWSAQMAEAEVVVDDWKFAAEQLVRWSDRARVLADRVPSTAKQLTRDHTVFHREGFLMKMANPTPPVDATPLCSTSQ